MSQDNLYQLAKKVVEDSERLTELWDKIYFFNEHKTLPDEGLAKTYDVNDLSVGEIITKLLTLPSYISKNKKKLKQMKEGSAYEVLKANIEAKEKELQAIKDLRNDQ